MSIIGGNYNGTMIVNSLYSSGEGHMWPYKGGKLIPANIGFSVSKTVDGEEPSETQVYTFRLDELQDGEWINIQTKHNYKRAINFEELLYESSNTYWYRMTEDVASVTDGIADDSWFIIKVVVTEEISGDDEIFHEAHIAYKVTDKEHLISEEHTINENALEALDPSVSDGGVSKIEFKNTSNAQETLEAKKVLVGENLKDEQFEFSATAMESNPKDGIDVSEFHSVTKNDASGNVSFGTLSFFGIGTWKYLIKETSDEGVGITNDKSEFEVTFTVRKSDNGFEVIKTIMSPKVGKSRLRQLSNACSLTTEYSL